ncbi:hypothetical protein DdX_12617 [Ditylenchus destructor]|uniref:Uncharacterized protein n=1 Tax=Ditylenchus destructor TaxID=166010 RepID=A0AAD4R071_9BILA|nr:hypothetical protein DdX_12617 [Ditylenchus destructor]
MPSYDDSKYRCCCCHVERCALLYALIGGGVSLFLAIGNFLRQEWIYGATLFMAVNFSLYFWILLAQYKRKSALYLPFLIGNGMLLMAGAFALIYLIVMYFYLPVYFVDWIHDKLPKEDVDQVPPETGMISITAIFVNSLGGAASRLSQAGSAGSVHQRRFAHRHQYALDCCSGVEQHETISGLRPSSSCYSGVRVVRE